MQATPQKKPRLLTGRAVLLWLVGFFVVVFAVNAVLVRAAISTFGGVETLSSYKAGLQFEQELAVAEHQDGLHWQVERQAHTRWRGDAAHSTSSRARRQGRAARRA